VDGSVLVVDAGDTRWQVVRHAADQFAAQDGTVLGVVLNNRRYYIPNFIYRKL
jgi:Mrp family chromosome partitioning ATPase